MSEHRQPIEIWTIRLPQIKGKKPPKNCKQKIELFPAHYWALDWEPGSKFFNPRPPLQGEARKLFWETLYRVRVNGVWKGEGSKYVLLAKSEIFEMYFL